MWLNDMLHYFSAVYSIYVHVESVSITTTEENAKLSLSLQTDKGGKCYNKTGKHYESTILLNIQATQGQIFGKLI